MLLSRYGGLPSNPSASPSNSSNSPTRAGLASPYTPPRSWRRRKTELCRKFYIRPLWRLGRLHFVCAAVLLLLMITLQTSTTSLVGGDDEAAAEAEAAEHGGGGGEGGGQGSCSPIGKQVQATHWSDVGSTSDWLPCCPGSGWGKVPFADHYECIAAEADLSTPKLRSKKLAAVRELVDTHKRAPQYPPLKEKVMMFAFAFETMDAANTPSYGAQPWIPLFLRSAGASGLNFTVIGNIGTLYGPMPPNVKLVSMTYSQFIRKATDQLFQVVPPDELLEAPHSKADDFKPFLASFFKKQIEGFGWWGYCDVDMFVGNIRAVLPQETLDLYDVVTPIATSPGQSFQMWSAFSMFRNTSQLVNMHSQADQSQLKDVLLKPAVGNFASNGQLSISSLLLAKVKSGSSRLRLLHDGVPFGWDAKCTDPRTGMVGQSRCNECVLSINKHGDSMVVHDHGLARYTDVLLCHFRVGKPAFAWRMDALNGRGTELVAEANLIFQSFPEGFRLHVPGSHHSAHNLEGRTKRLAAHRMPKILRQAGSFLFGGKVSGKGGVNADDDNAADLRSAAQQTDDDDDGEGADTRGAAPESADDDMLNKLRNKSKQRSEAAIALAKAEAAQRALELDNYNDDDKVGDDADDKIEDDDKSGQSAPDPRIMLFTLIFGESAANNPWLRLFLRSAAYSGVNYTIVGSPAVPFYLPDNVQQIEITLQEIVGLLEEKVFNGEILTELKNISFYKAIDFKPLLGYLFQDPYLHDFDWWGHIDNDMLMGNVRKFLPGKLLQHFDVVSPLETFVGDMFRTWGPFNMYRNTEKVNTLFKLAGPKLRKLFAVPDGMWFDEWAQGNHDKYDKKNELSNVSMTHIINQHAGTLGVRLLGPETSKMPFMWDGACNPGIGHHCGECRQRITVFGELRQHMYMNGRWFPVILCHYQMGKKYMAEPLRMMKDEKWGKALSENQIYIGGFSLDVVNLQHWNEDADLAKEAERLVRVEEKREAFLAGRRALQLKRNQDRLKRIKEESKKKRIATSVNEKLERTRRLAERKKRASESEFAPGTEKKRKKKKKKKKKPTIHVQADPFKKKKKQDT
eukprot:gene11251-18053_t